MNHTKLKTVVILLATSKVQAACWAQKGKWGTAGCLFVNCFQRLARCMLNSSCRSALHCDANCGEEINGNSCHLICELTFGYGNEAYKSVLQCMVGNKCLPVSNMDGRCLAQDNQTVNNLTNIEQVKGKWWIVRGLNCGQEGWPGAFDYFPCQRDDFVQENEAWFDQISYCGGRNNTCSTPIVNTNAAVEITSPGVITHWYIDAPLKPQIEFWRVLSFPSPDWMLYVYCGSTPAGPYGGGSVVSRSARTADAIPDWIRDNFRRTAIQYGFDYDAMCISNSIECEN